MTILSEKQQQVLAELSQEAQICQHFYLTGGTALSEYYLQHRLSEDLDLFSEEEFEPQSILAILGKLKPLLAFKEVRYEQSFNRNLYFLIFKDDVIKTEFTYFPFLRIERKKKVGSLEVDSMDYRISD